MYYMSKTRKYDTNSLEHLSKSISLLLLTRLAVTRSRLTSLRPTHVGHVGLQLVACLVLQQRVISSVDKAR